jgi:hypothetical protein
MTEGAGSPPTEEPAAQPSAEDTPEAPAADVTSPPADSPAAQPSPAPVPSSPAPVPSLEKSLDERKAALDSDLATYGAQGWRIESRSEFQATIVKGDRPNTVLHLILTIITLGLWAIVWILLAIFRGEKRQLVTVDDFGNIVATKI